MRPCRGHPEIPRPRRKDRHAREWGGGDWDTLHGERTEEEKEERQKGRKKSCPRWPTGGRPTSFPLPSCWSRVFPPSADSPFRPVRFGSTRFSLMGADKADSVAWFGRLEWLVGWLVDTVRRQTGNLQ